MDIGRTLTLLAIAGTLSGCASRNGGLLTEPLPPAAPLEAGGPWIAHRFGNPHLLHTGERQVDVIALLAPPDEIPDRRSEQELAVLVKRFEAGRDEAAKIRVRNMIVGELVDASVANCNVYLLNVRGSQLASRSIADVMTSGLATAGSLATPERSAKLLAGLASFTNATGAAVDRDIFAQTGVELVAKQIGTARTQARSQIEKRKIEKSYHDWDLGAALADVTEFHSECSMMWGLSRLEDVVARRDAAVLAARQVAAKVMAAGGTAKQVNAALAGVLESEINQDAAESALGEPGTSSIFDTDVHALADVAELCLEWGQSLIDSNAAGDYEALTKLKPFASECLPAGAPEGFNNGFSVLTQDQLKTYAGLTAAERQQKLEAIRSDLDNAANALANRISARRARAAEASKTMAANGATATETAAEIDKIADADPTDPALVAMKGAADAMAKASKATGAAVDGAARGALQAYLQGYKAPEIHYARPKPKENAIAAKRK